MDTVRTAFSTLKEACSFKKRWKDKRAVTEIIKQTESYLDLLVSLYLKPD